MRPLSRPLILLLTMVVIQITESRIEVGQPPVETALPTELQSLNLVSMRIRRFVANLLWMRLDDYLHSSDVIMPRGAKLTQEGKPISGGVSARLSAPEVLPLARLVVLLDPSFVQAGMVIGGQLLRDTSVKPEATEFVQALIRANPSHPRLYQLYYTIGNLRWERGDFRGARPYLEKAVELYDRLEDTKLMQKFNEPPSAPGDNLLLRGAITRLVNCTVVLEDYEAAVQWWRRSDGFDASNKFVRTIALYIQQRSRGKVDRDELALTYQKLVREDLDRGNALAAAAMPASKEFRGAEMLKGGKDQPLEDPMVRTPQAWKTVAIGLPFELAVKVGTVLATLCVLGLLGWRFGWLGR